MTEENKQEENKTENAKSLSDMLGMSFDENGNWSAKDIGKALMMRKLNRKERRKQNALDRKAK